MTRLTKKIAVYGVYRAKVPVEKSFWQIFDEGNLEDLWKEPKETEEREMGGRFEFHGSGRELYLAVVKALKRVPKGHVDVSAREFLRNPEEYSYEGVWIDKEIESG